MEPNKFEKHIKKQLGEREIQPSQEAWNKISGQLDNFQQPKKKGYFSYAIAASFIGILIASILYFNSKTTQIVPDVQIVETPNKSTEKGKDINLIQENSIKNEITKVDKVEFKKVNKAVTDKNKISDTIDAIVSTEKVGIAYEKTVLALQTSEDIIDTKILEIVAQADLLEQDNNTLTDAEVDSLLRMAQQEILADKIFKEDRTVDAMALLIEVEDELDQSFRDQIFETLKTGFIKVRTAVADRNN